MTSIVSDSGAWLNAIRPNSNARFYAIALAIVIAVAIGWQERDDEFITPDSGLGYWLGIVGSSMMVGLLYYSYRKRQKHGRGLWTIPTWFRIHMILGVVGPLLVVFHTNFHLKAMNSSVALASMLIVAFSGLVGRYIYGQFHVGLNERKLAVNEINATLKAMRAEFGDHGMLAEAIFDDVDVFGRAIMDRPESNALTSFLFGATRRVVAVWKRRQVREKIRTLIAAKGKSEGWNWRERRRRGNELTEAASIYFRATLKVVELQFFERLFSLWHLFHLPLFFVMVLTAVIHVWAVHRY